LSAWFGILVVLTGLAFCFVALRLLEVFASPHPEILRKLMHVSMGLITASFPWLFDQIWPVLLLAVGSVATLILVRSGVSAVGSLRGVLHGVERSSWGELLFPVAVAIVFVLADGDPLLYSVPILILTLADAVAALIGVYYGQIQFSTLEGSKSIEGSLAFFIVAFLCVHIPVLLFTEVGRLESLLIGLLMGVIAMMFEAVAWRGLDNLFIPVVSFALLQTYLDMDAAALSVRLVVILSLGVLLLLWRRRSTLDDSALIGAGLVAYGAWAIGGLYWLLVPVSVFLIATVLARCAEPEHRGKIHTVYALLSIAGPGFVYLILHRNVSSADLLFAYSVAFAAHLTMLGISLAHFGRQHLRSISFVRAMLQGWLVVLLPFVLMWGLDLRLIATAVIGGLAMLLAALAFLHLQPNLDDCPVSPERWTRQALISAVVSALAWLSIGVEGRGGLQG
jgi:phytol kinase